MITAAAPAALPPQGGLYRYALALTRNRADALDLVQSTYERALRRGLAGVGAEQVLAWLMTIARNQFLDQVRRVAVRARYHRCMAAEAAALPDGGDQPAWRALTLADLHAAVDALDPALAAVYRLHAFDELGYAAIAVQLALPISTVGTRLLRARRRLRDLLARRVAFMQDERDGSGAAAVVISTCVL
jgi:RNA polymerase sigma-70 factor (ECF subfamily)